MIRCQAILCLYSLPPSSRNNLSSTDFLDALSKLFSSYPRKHCMFVGDFNVHYNDKAKSDVKKIVSLLNSHSLKPHVKSSTHTTLHCLSFWTAMPLSESERLYRKLDVHGTMTLFMRQSVKDVKPNVNGGNLNLKYTVKYTNPKEMPSARL